MLIYFVQTHHRYVRRTGSVGVELHASAPMAVNLILYSCFSVPEATGYLSAVRQFHFSCETAFVSAQIQAVIIHTKLRVTV